MKRNVLASLVPALVLGLSLPVLAGDSAKKCTAEFSTCMKEMYSKVKERGWVGIEMDEVKETGQTVVTRVVDESPAQKAGFQKGDILFALNGVQIAKDNHDAMKAQYKEFKPGKTVQYTVLRAGSETPLTVTLGELPESVLAQWVGHHAVEHLKTDNEVAQTN